MDKLLNYLSLAARARKLRAGAFLTEKAVKEGAARLVVVAGDTSRRSAHDLARMCEYYSVPCVTYGDKESLGRHTGHEYRSVVAVTDEGLANAFLALLGKQENQAE